MVIQIFIVILGVIYTENSIINGYQRYHLVNITRSMYDDTKVEKSKIQNQNVPRPLACVAEEIYGMVSIFHHLKSVVLAREWMIQTQRLPCIVAKCVERSLCVRECVKTPG